MIVYEIGKNERKLFGKKGKITETKGCNLTYYNICYMLKLHTGDGKERENRE